MVRRDFIDPEDRKLFEEWGLKRVRQMMAAGHFDTELRRPMARWIAEREALALKWRRLALIAAIILAFAISAAIMSGTQY